MGFLTTIVIYNDYLEKICNDGETLSIIKRHASGLNPTNETSNMKLFTPRDGEDFSIYIHKDNHVMELSPYSTETTKIMRSNPEYLIKTIKQTKKYIRGLEKELKLNKSR